MSFEAKLLIALFFVAIIAVNVYALREARKELKNIDTDILSSNIED